MKLTQLILSPSPGTPDAYLYADTYAMYNTGGKLDDPENDPAWILRDQKGNPGYIPFDLTRQYAADISSQGWQSRFLEWLFQQLRGPVGSNLTRAYPYVFLDDVNLILSWTPPGGGQPVGVAVSDPKRNALYPVIAGRPVTSDVSWALWFVKHLQVIQAAVRSVWSKADVKLIHNAVWRNSPSGMDSWSDPVVMKQWGAADILCKEQGFMDPGLTGGTGYWSLFSLSYWMQTAHILGKSILIREYDFSNLAYSLACTWLTTNGTDYVEYKPPAGQELPADVAQTLARVLPQDMGTADGPATRNNGLWFRAFSKGFAVANEPGAPSVTFPPPRACRALIGQLVNGSIPLGPTQGGVYLWT